MCEKGLDFAVVVRAQNVLKGDKAAIMGVTHVVREVYQGLEHATLRFEEYEDRNVCLRLPLSQFVTVFRSFEQSVSTLKVGNPVHDIGYVKYTGRNYRNQTVLVVSSCSGDLSVTVSDKTSLNELIKILARML